MEAFGGSSSTSCTQDGHIDVAMQMDQNNSSPWKPWVVVKEEPPVDASTSIENSMR